jgi:hypothetical protein
MILKRQKLVKAVALLLAFSVFQLYAQANRVVAAGPETSIQDPATPAPQATGKLSTTANRNILVDRNEASTGATILDGATLQTSDCVSATVRFGPLDEVSLGINSVAVINYGAGKLRVTLKQGCAIVRTGPDVEGTIDTPDGKSTSATQPDSSNRRSTEVCYPSGTAREFNPICAGGATAPSAPSAGTPTGRWILLSVVGAVAALVAVAASGSGENSSFSAPS